MKKIINIKLSNDPDIHVRSVLFFDDEDKYEFIMTALNSLQDPKALSELKIMIKGIELAQKR